MIWRPGCATGMRKTATYAKNGDSIFRILGKNGYRWVTNAANQVEWYGKGYIVGTITDITPIWNCGKSWNSRTVPSGRR